MTTLLAILGASLAASLGFALGYWRGRADEREKFPSVAGTFDRAPGPSERDRAYFKRKWEEHISVLDPRHPIQQAQRFTPDYQAHFQDAEGGSSTSVPFIEDERVPFGKVYYVDKKGFDEMMAGSPPARHDDEEKP